MPALEDGIKFLDGSDEWQDSPVSSPAVCQLGDVEAILTSKQEDTVYKMTLKGEGVNVSIKLTPNEVDNDRKVELENNGSDPTNLRKESPGMVCNNQSMIVAS